MLGILKKEEGNIVVFHLWKNLEYKRRINLSLAIIVTGMVIQLVMYQAIPGVFIVFVGNLFLLTKGYSNSVDTGGYNAGQDWEEVKKEHLDQVLRIDKKSKRWDLSGFEITNIIGTVVFTLILVLCLIGVYYGYESNNESLVILTFNAVALMLPHWFTGTRSILRMPALVNKIKIYQNLLELMEKELTGFQVKYYMLLTGDSNKLPEDVKFMTKMEDQPEGIMGLYGQICINSVQGKDYPYFYVVLVSRKSYPLSQIKEKAREYPKLICTLEENEEVNYIIIRQYTTKNSGYHTNWAMQKIILREGLELLKLSKESAPNR